MKPRRFLAELILAVVLAAALTQVPAGHTIAAPLAPMGTAFTYQGQLIKGGSPVNDTCDFRFILYDAQTGGSQVGTTQDKLNITVTGGLFTVPDLDFGNGIFTGEARWLDVLVRCPAGSGGYATIGLLPQALNPTPYALHAGRAALASAAPWSGLIGVPAGFADGVDNDTTYTADGTLKLTGTQFSIPKTYQLPQGCAESEIARWYDLDETWVCSQDTGDITSVVAGAGLTGGGLSGKVTIDAQFGGTGASTYIARSDHNHWGAVWTGAGTGLNLSGGTTGIHAEGSAADLDLGGTGTIVADDSTGADMELRSNDEVVVHLDDDNDSGSSFTVKNGANTNVFSVNEEGVMTWGSWAARTGYLSVPSAAFQPKLSTQSYANDEMELWSFEEGYFYAPVALPDGAVITRMTFFWKDLDATYDMDCSLLRNNLSTPSLITIAEASEQRLKRLQQQL